MAHCHPDPFTGLKRFGCGLGKAARGKIPLDPLPIDRMQPSVDEPDGNLVVRAGDVFVNGPNKFIAISLLGSVSFWLVTSSPSSPLLPSSFFNRPR